MNLSQSFTQSQSIPSSWLWIFISFWDIQVSGQVPRKASPHMLPFSQIATIGKKTSGHLRASQSLSFSEFLQFSGPMTKDSSCLFCVFPCFPILRPPGTISTRIAVSTFGSLLCHATAVPRAVAERRRCTGTAERRGKTGPLTAPGASNGDVLGWSQYHKLVYKPLS